MHRFFLNQKLPEIGTMILHERSLVHQMRGVLKLKARENIALFNGSGMDFLFSIIKITPQAVFGHITGVVENKRDSARRVLLYQALIKKNNFEWMLQKCTELGVKKFIPVISKRSIKRGLNRERLEKIAREATEQSGQDKIPKITEPVQFSEAVSGINSPMGEGATLILCDPGGANNRLPAISNQLPIHIFIGPEGGFTEQEVNAVRERGGVILSLGQRILRAETAAVATASLLLTEE